MRQEIDLPILKEYYSNPEFDDYALQVRNELMYFYDVDIEDANWVVCEENTANFMHSVWFKMNPEECAKKIADKLTINDGSVDKDAYSNIIITEGSSLEVVDGKEDIGEHFKKYMKKKKAEKPNKKKTCCGC